MVGDETIERCAETFVSLPVEIHLGPEQVLYRFEDVELSTHGPVASLKFTRVPLTRRNDAEALARSRLRGGAIAFLTPFFISSPS